jgi:hypothetical protein
MSFFPEQKRESAYQQSCLILQLKTEKKSSALQIFNQCNFVGLLAKTRCDKKLNYEKREKAEL